MSRTKEQMVAAIENARDEFQTATYGEDVRGGMVDIADVVAEAVGDQLIAVDTGLTQSGAGADAYISGRWMIKQNGGQITDNQTYQSFNDFPVGFIGFVNSTASGITDGPYQYFIGTVMSFSPNGGVSNGALQIAIVTTASTVYDVPVGTIFTRHYSSASQAWVSWKRVQAATDKTLLVSNAPADAYISGRWMIKQNGGQITDNQTYQSFNDLPVGFVGFVNASVSGITDGPYPTFIGTVMSFSPNGAVTHGAVQIAIVTTASSVHDAPVGMIFTRHYSSASSAWQSWKRVQGEKKAYTVSHGGAYPSLTALCQSLANDNDEKIVYVEAGNYNIYAEYLDANVPSPPSGTSTNDYAAYCVNIPNNTTLIGLGEVNLIWDAPSNLSDLDAPFYDASATYVYGDYCTQDGSVWCCKTAITTPEAFDSSKWIEMRAITAIESKIWSVLNVEQNVTVDNFTITGKNCRYLIHDDPHNAYTGTTHIYKNLRLSRQSNDNGYGFSMCMGMGYVNDGHYTFENLVINNALTTNASFAIGGHEGQTYASGRNYHGADITIKDCVLLAAGPYALHFQTISHNAGQQRIRALISNCYIGNKVLLDALSSGSGTQQYFDITILNSGVPEVVVEVADNPYPVKVYNHG